MKIVKLTGGGKIEIGEAPTPTPKAGEVLIKTAVSAVCGSEMHDYRGGGCGGGNSGHEGAGTVAALGDGVTTLAVGDRIGASAIAGCGACEQCAAGRYTWCANYTFHGSMHAEYFTVPALACHKLPDDIPWKVGVLITGDALGVPYHTSTKVGSPEYKTVAVFGLGPVGLATVMLQTHLGRRVIGIDRSPDRVALARQMGATDTILADDGVDVVAEIKALTDGCGADICIEAAGSPITAKLCFKAVRTAGCVVFNGEQPSVELSPSEDFIRRDITAVGSWFYHFHEYTDMLALYRAGLPLESLVTHKFGVDEAADAFRAMDGKSGKVLLVYG